MPRKIRPIRVEGNIAYVPLTKGYEAVIDAEDAEMIGREIWFVDASFSKDGALKSAYAARYARKDEGTRGRIWMHRLLANAPDHLMTDHIDGDGLNNRKANLRLATMAQNQQNRGPQANNTSGFKGVEWEARRSKWRAMICANGVRRHVGYFDDAEEAAAAYARAADELHGEFRRVA